MSNSGGDVSKSTSDSEKSPKEEKPEVVEEVPVTPKTDVFQDVDDEITDKIEIIEKIEVKETTSEVTTEEKGDETDKEKEKTEKVGLKRTNSVKARANLFQELEKKQKEIEKPVLQKPKRGKFLLESQPKKVLTFVCYPFIVPSLRLRAELEMEQTKDQSNKSIASVSDDSGTEFGKFLSFV